MSRKQIEINPKIIENIKYEALNKIMKYTHWDDETLGTFTREAIDEMEQKISAYKKKIDFKKQQQLNNPW